MAMKDDRLVRYTHKLIALDAAGKLGLLKQGDYGFRLIVGPYTVDYWPGRGTWRTPTGSKTGNGWNTLMTYLELYGERE